MPINVKGLFETLQYKANNIDSSTNTAEILDTLKAIKLSDGNTVISYDSDGALPDAATTNIKLAYVKNTGIVKFNNGTWDTLTGSLSGVTVTVPEGGIGSAYGYAAGGNASPSTTRTNVIEKYSFSVDANATDVGDLAYYMSVGAGASSTTDGYTVAGSGNTTNPSPAGISYQHIQKYSFTTDGNATDIADTASLNSDQVKGAESTEHGYIMRQLDAERFPFATDENSVDIGDLTHRNSVTGATSSATHIYSTGANPSHPSSRGPDIEKFAFSSSISSTDVGDLILGVMGTSSNKSSTFGYITAGYGSPTGATPVTIYNVIQKFPFSTDENATDVGDLTGAKWYASSSSSTTHGYVAGGAPSTPTAGNNVIEKFDTATDGNATDVGDLTVSMSRRAGAEV